MNAIKQQLKQIKGRHIVAFIGLSAIVWVVVVVGLAAMIVVSGEQNQAQQADAIIVLGSGLRRDGRPGDALYRRSVWAAGLYREGYAPAVICTGGVGEGQRRSEASACAEVLQGRGVLPEAIYLDETSRSTEENALYSHEIMLERGWDEAIIVTDSFHMLRAGWIFDSRGDNDGIVHYRSPVPRDWVRSYFYTRHFTREIVALHWQAFKDLLNLPVTYVGHM